MTDSPHRITAAQVADQLTLAGLPVTDETIRRWANDGQIVSTRTPTGRLWFAPSVVAEILADHGHKPAEAA